MSTSASEYWRQRKEREARRPARRLPERPITERYCFCPRTPLWVDRCKDCGKTPFTD